MNALIHLYVCFSASHLIHLKKVIIINFSKIWLFSFNFIVIFSIFSKFISHTLYVFNKTRTFFKKTTYVFKKYKDGLFLD